MNELQIDLLRALNAAGKFGICLDDLLADMRRGRHRDLSRPELETALRSLADESNAKTFTDSLRQKRWGITAVGASALQEAGL
jgi:hypothetical protein